MGQYMITYLIISKILEYILYFRLSTIQTASSTWDRQTGQRPLVTPSALVDIHDELGLDWSSRLMSPLLEPPFMIHPGPSREYHPPQPLRGFARPPREQKIHARALLDQTIRGRRFLRSARRFSGDFPFHFSSRGFPFSSYERLRDRPREITRLQAPTFWACGRPRDCTAPGLQQRKEPGHVIPHCTHDFQCACFFCAGGPSWS